MQLTFQINDSLLTLHAETEGDGWRVRLPDGTEHYLLAARLPDDVIKITLPNPDPTVNRTLRIPFAHTESGVEIAHSGETYLFTPAADRKSPRKRAASSGALTAPMVGVVADVLVTEGQTVEAYQPLVILEAMKVMATLEAPFPGIVTKLYVRKKEQVAHNAPIIDIQPLESPPKP